MFARSAALIAASLMSVQAFASDIVVFDPPPGYSGVSFGNDVAVSDDGKALAVGAPGHGGGKVLVYTKALPEPTPEEPEPTEEVWGAPVVLAPGGTSDSFFGYSVDMTPSGSVIVAGGPTYNGGKGGFQVWQKASGAYSAAQTVAVTSSRTNLAGWAISMSDDASVVVLGVLMAALDNETESPPGEAYVFERTGGSYALKATLKSPSPNNEDQYGFDVSVSGDGSKIAVGSPGTKLQGASEMERQGAVFVYRRSQNWINPTMVTFPESRELDAVGYSVSFNRAADVLFVGIPNRDVYASGGGSSTLNTGVIAVYTGDSLGLQQTISKSDSPAGWKLGYRLASSDDGASLLSGQPRAVVNGQERGTLTVLTGYGYKTINGNWTPSDADESGEFGSAVALNGAGDTGVIGWPSAHSGTGATVLITGITQLEHNGFPPPDDPTDPEDPPPSCTSGPDADNDGVCDNVDGEISGPADPIRDSGGDLGAGTPAGPAQEDAVNTIADSVNIILDGGTIDDPMDAATQAAWRAATGDQRSQQAAAPTASEVPKLPGAR